MSPDSIISQGAIILSRLRSNLLQTTFGLASSEPHSNVLQGRFNQNLGMNNSISMVNRQAAGIGAGEIDMYFPQSRYHYGFSLPNLSFTIGFLF